MSSLKAHDQTGASTAEADIETVLDVSGPDYETFSYAASNSGTRGDVYFVTLTYDGETYDVVIKFEPTSETVVGLEPYLHEYVGERTDVPVPGILVAESNPDADVRPYFVTARIDGANLADHFDRLSLGAQRDVLDQIGHILADLHRSIAFEGFGRFALDDGYLRIRDLTWDWREYFAQLTRQRVGCLSGTPFEDLIDPARQHLRGAFEVVPTTGTPRLVHDDFRPANLLYDPEASSITGVLDWQEMLAGTAAYNLAQTEFLFVDSVIRDGDDREDLRDQFRTAYAAERDFVFDESYERVRPIYQLSTLLWRMGGFESACDGASGLTRARAEAYYRRHFERLVADL